jgi:hypothetical protein
LKKYVESNIEDAVVALKNSKVLSVVCVYKALNPYAHTLLDVLIKFKELRLVGANACPPIGAHPFCCTAANNCKFGIVGDVSAHPAKHD